jgi:hypothetical protein
MRLLEANGAEEVRKAEMERLDMMLGILTPQVMNGNLGAMETALKISKQRAELSGANKIDPLAALHLDISKLSTSQLERIKKGESILDVLIDSGKQAAPADASSSGVGIEEEAGERGDSDLPTVPS